MAGNISNCCESWAARARARDVDAILSPLVSLIATAYRDNVTHMTGLGNAGE